MESIGEIIEKRTEISDKKQETEKKKSRSHLFKKGQSGNPKGKPPGTVSITTAIKKKLLEIYPATGTDENKQKKRYLDKLIESIMRNALENGEARTQKDIWNYIDGMPRGTMSIEADKESLAVLTNYFRNIAKSKK